MSRVVEGSVSADLELSSRQWRVLVILNRIGPTTLGQVASATHLDHSQVSRASYELLEKGLISMSSDQGDRRKQLLSVSALGMDVLRRGIVGSQDRQARLRATMSDAEYKVFSLKTLIQTPTAPLAINFLATCTPSCVATSSALPLWTSSGH